MTDQSTLWRRRTLVGAILAGYPIRTCLAPAKTNLVLRFINTVTHSEGDSGCDDMLVLGQEDASCQ